MTLILSLTNRQPGYVLNARKGNGGSNWLAPGERDARKGKKHVLLLSVHSHSARFPRASRASDSFSLSSRLPTTWMNKQPLWIEFDLENAYTVLLNPLQVGFIYFKAWWEGMGRRRGLLGAGGGEGGIIDRGGVPWVIFTITQLHLYAIKIKHSCRQIWPLVCSYY